MRKYFPAGLYSALFFLLSFINGCYVAGGIHGRCVPPEKIACGKPRVIAIDIVVNPPEALGKHIERCKDVTIHIRDSLNGNFVAVPMVLESVRLKFGELHWNATMKPIPCDSGIGYVEYYIDYMFGLKYYRTKYYRIPVSRD
jgi:hypothetical protein